MKRGYCETRQASANSPSHRVAGYAQLKLRESSENCSLYCRRRAYSEAACLRALLRMAVRASCTVVGALLRDANDLPSYPVAAMLRPLTSTAVVLTQRSPLSH